MGFDPEFVVKGYYDKVTIQGRDGSIETIVTDEPLVVIKNLVKKTDDQTYRYLGGAVGVINYDAIRLWEKIPKRHNITEPIMEFGIYNDGILFDNKQKKSLYFYYEENRVDEIKTSEPIFDDFKMSKISTNLDKNEFSKIVESAKKYIYDGDVFQVVLSRKFSFEAHGDLRQELVSDEKELAEHTMLVDLGRNDIGKVCDYGTVCVNKLMEVKQFSHVQHMVTHVVGKLNKNYDMYDAFKAVFPAGTVSGAPKVRAMEIIDELEPESRG